MKSKSCRDERVEAVEIEIASESSIKMERIESAAAPRQKSGEQSREATSRRARADQIGDHK